MKVVDFDGSMLDATFHVIPPEDGIISLDYESSGGSHRDAIARRNHQYREGLNVLFTRLQSMNAVITEIRIETGKARFLPAAEQRIVIPNRAFPVSLASIANLDEFRQEISRYGREVGQQSAGSSKGGSSRRLRIFLTGVPTDRAALESQLAGRAAEANAGGVAAGVNRVAGVSSGGQGFVVSHAVRKVIEEYAVAWAVRYYEGQGWTVHDVGATESFDLQCTRGGMAERHVEVKGTTGLGETVILTRNEVLHANEWHPNVDLFIVTEISIDGRESDEPEASGGRALVYKNWQPAQESLTAVSYEYVTNVGNESSLAVWKQAD
ncbi:MAG: DUF3883 domain-containing protein [Planctomycetaceae bacterium]